VKRLIFLFAVLFSSTAYSDIQGRWVIDADLTLDFNSAHSGITDLEKELIRCMSSNSSLEISGSYFSFVVKKHSCSFGDKISTITDFDEKYKFKKIFENIDVVVLLSEDKEHNQSIDVIHQINEDLVWFYYPGDPPEYDTHLRYYYKRITENDSE